MSAATRPSHLRWGPLGLVALGGAVGASAREVVSLLVPDLGALPIAIPIVNIVGAFLLGYLYEAVTRLGHGDSRAKNLKLLLGTGFCGGFTTYSSLATDTAVLNANGHLGLAFVYALGTVILGAFATWAGIVLAAQMNSRRTATDSVGTVAR
ncbi:CrcB family protein [Leifsonia sp. YAF41]|uniref:fluoride efflux transporter FluC n=1 Tax=Leifsonia sp. YAF41 TaxID=3233086 RepID=UPI003F960BF3